MLFRPMFECGNGICWGSAPIRWTSLIVDVAFFYLFWLVIFYVVRMVMRKIIEVTSRKTKINMLLFVLAVFSAIATTYERVEVFNKTELNNLSCGWPMRYLSSGYTENPFDPPYPWTNRCGDLLTREWGDPLDVQWIFFISNIIFFYFLWLIIFYGGKEVIGKLRAKDGLFNNNSV
ncbi:MAG: hypothetical protein PHX30_02795 [Candidatus Pacebacteria bacterium]|nr:hypothetical protein [Candidatus Paceibacterota bacterium]